MKERITPEVGDVWIVEETNVSFYIEGVEEDVIIALQSVGKMLLHEIMIDTEVLHKHCTYLGKSKANINDLFKTENEE